MAIIGGALSKRGFHIIYAHVATQHGACPARTVCIAEPFVRCCSTSVTQIRLTAHRAMLSNCLSLVSERLEKQHLKAGLTVQEVAAATRSLYLAAPEDRLSELIQAQRVDGIL